MRKHDVHALSLMGRAGGRASARARRERRAYRELEDEAFELIASERYLRDEHDRRVSAGEHIIPLDAYD